MVTGHDPDGAGVVGGVTRSSESVMLSNEALALTVQNPTAVPKPVPPGSAAFTEAPRPPTTGVTLPWICPLRNRLRVSRYQVPEFAVNGIEASDAIVPPERRPTSSSPARSPT